ncbi:hypothetical protein [Polyangium sorediatum]|uniref:Uncharacterized protein n=1 Tax=Polyangium sorediatum TaxID=889274 RepID=A0ABT6NT00_9BACT|nr:hypothetical protein [Polyangium sorediatum]MDI1431416.1 hypothetical protein [Polyangium sorediatum]
MLDSIHALASEIERRWSSAEYRSTDFASIAHDCLAQAELHARFDEAEILRWAIAAEQLPEQHDLRGGFGQPPLTLWHGSRFFVDLYFWVTPETAVHDHGFTGAFTNLQGNSLHCMYGFDTHATPAPNLRLGSLALTGVEYLQPGSVRAIAGGRDFIHQVWHVSRPTITLVVRTFHEDGWSQFEYHPPGVAARIETSAAFTRRFQLLEYLSRTDHPSKESLAEELVLGGDPWSSFFYLTKVFAERSARSSRDPASFERLLSRLTERHGDWIRHLGDAIRSTDRHAGIRWARLADPTQRLVLALLSSLEDRTSIEDFITKHFPDAQPDAFLFEGLRGAREAQGITLNFSEGHWAILRNILRGATPEQIAMSLGGREALGEAQLGRLEAICADLRRVPLLAPLFTTRAGRR